DVDVLCDGTEMYLGGVMEHIEEAGIHSGDSACALPPITLGQDDIDRVRLSSEALASGIGVKGLMNVQYALKDYVLYVLEANPRASRTVPFVSKATGVHMAKACARIMVGATIAELRAEGLLPSDRDGASWPADAPVALKEAVLPFNRLRTPAGQTIDSLLSPEMKSTGEVMGIGPDFAVAFAKGQLSAVGVLPTSGTVFVSVANRDKRSMVFSAQRLAALGFSLLSTEGSELMIRWYGIGCETNAKLTESGAGPVDENGEPVRTIVDRINAHEVDLILNIASSTGGTRADGYEIRSAAISRRVPCVTTVQGATAAVHGIEAMRRGDVTVSPLQELHSGFTE